MAQLVLSLPLLTDREPTSPLVFDYWLADAAGRVQSYGRGTAEELPKSGGRLEPVVAVLSAAAVVWHPIYLPLAVARSILSVRADAARVRAVVSGVLEEQLLDDPESLHFAVFPGLVESPEARNEGDTHMAAAHEGEILLWVASCARAPLRAALQALETAGRPVTRLLAECVPCAGLERRAVVYGSAHGASCVLSTSHGVAHLPLQPGTVAFVEAQGPFTLTAEPSVLDQVEHLFGHPAELLSRGERVVMAVRSTWDLAQGEFSPSIAGWLTRRLQLWGHSLWHEAAWRPFRWGGLALLLLHVVALNGFAWQVHRDVVQRESAVRGVLQETFPDVAVVSDAPVQMRKATEQLARSRGLAGSLGGQPNPVSVLAVLSTLDPGLDVRSIRAQQGILTVQASGLSDHARAQSVLAGLRAQGWNVSLQNGALQVGSTEMHR